MYDPSDAFRFLASDGDVGSDYRSLVRALADNADRFGERLTVGDLTVICELPADAVLQRLIQLVDWKVVDQQHNGARLTSLADLRLREFSYDISPAGRIAWDAAEAINGLADDVGKLSIHRIHELGLRLTRLRESALADPFEPATFRASFEDVEAEVRRLRDEINGFRKELDLRLRPDATSTRLYASSLEFARFRDLVLAHIAEFQNELPPLRRHMRSVLADIDSVIDAHLMTLSDFDSAPGMDGASAQARRLERLRDQWSGVHAWLTDDPGGNESRWDALNARLITAINRLVDSAQRLAARDQARVDRTARLRDWTMLASTSEDEDCARLWMAVTGRFPARHIGGPAHDEQRDDHWAPRLLWREARHAPVSAHLLRIGARGVSNAPGARVRDISYEEQLRRELRRAARRRRAALLASVVGHGVHRISQVTCDSPEAADVVAELVLGALGAGSSRELRAHHDDLVVVSVPAGQDAGPRVPLAALRCTAGTLLLPDLLIDLRATDDPVWIEIRAEAAA